MTARGMAAALIALMAAGPATAAEAVLPLKVYGRATAIDGDGIRLIGGTEIRLFGIDAAEMRTEPVEGRRARAALDDLIGGGPVDCRVRDENRGRLVAVCATADGRIEDLGRAMLSLGDAVVYRRFTAGTEFEAPYDRAERQARIDGAGVWADQSERRWQAFESIGAIVAPMLVLLLSVLYTNHRDARRRREEAADREAAKRQELIGLARTLAADASEIADSYNMLRAPLRAIQTTGPVLDSRHDLELPAPRGRMIEANAVRIGLLPPNLQSSIAALLAFAERMQFHFNLLLTWRDLLGFERVGIARAEALAMMTWLHLHRFAARLENGATMEAAAEPIEPADWQAIEQQTGYSLERLMRGEDPIGGPHTAS